MTSPALVFEVSAQDFQSSVVQASLETPILLDFWADWCGPCRTLAPLLERLATDYGGGFRVGKIDIEQEQELAAAFQVQSIPFCVLIAGGRPVDAFSGALPESEIRAFLQRAGVEPGPAGGESDEAAPADPDSPAERLRAGLAAAMRGDPGAARERLEGIGEEEAEHSRAARILDGLAIWEELPPAGESPGSVEARRHLGDGVEALQGGDLDGAVERLLDSMAADKAFGGGLARRAAVLAFELMALEPGGDERAGAYRRRMATLLF